MLCAADWIEPQEQLAAKIGAVTGPGAISLEVRNRSSLASAEVARIREGLAVRLGSLGLHLVNADQANATVLVSLSEDFQNYVWLAEIHQGTSEPAIVMVSTPRPDTPPPSQDLWPMTIHKTLLWSQDTRILDVAVVSGTPQRMIVLDADNISLYKSESDRWQVEQSVALSHRHPWPRDLRGRVVPGKDHLFDAYLPGVFCRGVLSPLLTVNCYDSDDPWPLGSDPYSVRAFFAPSRNFFTGALAPGIGKQTTAQPFYSAAALPREKYTLWIFATVDGQVHMLDGINDHTAGKLGWGSDIASVHSNCGSGWQVLATANTDGSADAVRAFEITDREPASVARSLDFNGNITALWPETDGSNAVAVSRASETGKYAAYRLAIHCGQ